MRAREFLKEDEVENIAQLIKTNCQPFLPVIKSNTQFYRGFKNSGYLTSIDQFAANLTNRKPTDIPPKIHAFINEWFEKHYGKPWRNGIFVTSSSTEAQAYGKIFNFVPIGDFEYLYSPDILDMYTYSYENVQEMFSRESYENSNKKIFP
jgi:hypothetical protein